MEQKMPLCTIFITYYNTGDILYETIDSVLSQDYPNIELIISDDASTRVPMPIEKVESYVRERMRGNVKQLVVRCNEKNLGTVKHVELIRDLSTGEYCCGIAGDDLFNDEHVISVMVTRFEELGPKAEYMIGQVEMFDQHMQKSYGYCVQKHIIVLLKEENWAELYRQEMTACQLVGQCMIRRSLFQKMPRMSDRYKLVEDYSTHMWLLRNGFPIYWCDIVMVKHRGGGMSHGNISNNPQVFIDYCQDYMTVFEEEVEPYRNNIDTQTYEKAAEAYEFFVFQHDSSVKISLHPKICKLLRIRNPQDLSSRKELIDLLGNPITSLKTICAMMPILFNILLVVQAEQVMVLSGFLHIIAASVQIINAVFLVILLIAVLTEVACFFALRLYSFYRGLKPSYF